MDQMPSSRAQPTLLPVLHSYICFVLRLSFGVSHLLFCTCCLHACEGTGRQTAERALHLVGPPEPLRQ